MRRPQIIASFAAALLVFVPGCASQSSYTTTFVLSIDPTQSMTVTETLPPTVATPTPTLNPSTITSASDGLITHTPGSHVCILSTLTTNSYPATYTGYREIEDPVYIELTSQAQIDDLIVSQGCTTISGDVTISNSYVGAFNLSGVTEISGRIQTSYLEAQIWIPGLTEVIAPDLMYLDYVELINMPALTTISFPKLTNATQLIFRLNSTVGTSVSVPSWIKGNEISILGHFTSLDFTSLQYLTGALIIAPNETQFPDSLDWVKTPPLAVSFPALEQVAQLSIMANLSSIDFPVLTTVEIETVGGYDADFRGFNIANTGNILNVMVPKLNHSNQLTLRGNIGSFSFPSLIDLNGNLVIDTKIPLNVDTSPLQSVGGLNLSGTITGYDLSSLKNLAYGLSISSTIPVAAFNCSPAYQFYNSVTHSPNISSAYGTLAQPRGNFDFGYGPNVSCSGYTPPVNTPTATENALSNGAKMGIGLGLGLGSVIILCAFCVRNEARKSKRDAQRLKPPAYENELEARGGHIRRQSDDVEGEMLPGYQPRGASGHVVIEDGGVEDAFLEPPTYVDGDSSRHESDGVRTSADSRTETPRDNSGV